MEMYLEFWERQTLDCRYGVLVPKADVERVRAMTDEEINTYLQDERCCDWVEEKQEIVESAGEVEDVKLVEDSGHEYQKWRTTFTENDATPAPPVKPKLERYVATVEIVLPAGIEFEAEACDALSAALSETLKFEGIIADWRYIQQGGQFVGPRLRTLDPADDWEIDAEAEPGPQGAPVAPETYHERTLKLAQEHDLNKQFVEEVRRLIENGGLPDGDYNRGLLFGVAAENVADRWLQGERKGAVYYNLKRF